MSATQSQQPDIFQKYEEAKKNSGRYVKFTPGEKRQLQFNPNKIEITDSIFQGKKTGGKSVEFTVIDPREPMQEKILSMGIKKAEAIMALLKANKYFLDVTKIGSGKDSQFIAVPIT